MEMILLCSYVLTYYFISRLGFFFSYILLYGEKFRCLESDSGIDRNVIFMPLVGDIIILICILSTFSKAIQFIITKPEDILLLIMTKRKVKTKYSDLYLAAQENPELMMKALEEVERDLAKFKSR